MKKWKQMTAAFLAIIFAVTAFPIQTLAAGDNTQKEEVVYVNLEADGSVKEINVVNIFDLEKESSIVDYGDYEALRNMNTEDGIDYTDDTVTINAGAGKLYYEGKLKNNTMPWIITIHYFMDGKEYPADEIAGRSGKLEIKISTRKNPDCDSSFFEGYALQASLTLDTNKAENIQAESATVANVGSDKQLTFTILPNTEKDFTVSANVVDFEMSSIAMNGIRMNLDIDIDDNTLLGKVDEIVEAVQEVYDGAKKLDKGALDLYEAVGKLNQASGELYSGMGSICAGASQLESGLGTLSSRNKQLTEGAWTTYVSLCSAAQSQLNEQLKANGMKTVTLTPDNYSEVLLNLLTQMDADAVYNEAYDIALAQVTDQVDASEAALYEGYVQSQAASIYKAYVQSQADALYKRAAYEGVVSQLVASGNYTLEQASAYMDTPEGQAVLTDAIAALTKEQKDNIIEEAIKQLTTEQKAQILKGAVESLTEEQKAQIKDAYIEQVMNSDQVSVSINEAVCTVNTAANDVVALKQQLDTYGAFYKGLVEYTNAVKTAETGAGELTGGLGTFYSNFETYKNSVGDLYKAVGTLQEGTRKLSDGTKEFVDETDDIDTRVSDEISNVTSSMTGKDVETVSFVSEKNTNIKSVQFVIQTEQIAVKASDDVKEEEGNSLTFWEKFTSLFQ